MVLMEGPWTPPLSHEDLIQGSHEWIYITLALIWCEVEIRHMMALEEERKRRAEEENTKHATDLTTLPPAWPAHY